MRLDQNNFHVFLGLWDLHSWRVGMIRLVMVAAMAFSVGIVAIPSGAHAVDGYPVLNPAYGLARPDRYGKMKAASNKAAPKKTAAAKASPKPR